VACSAYCVFRSSKGSTHPPCKASRQLAARYAVGKAQVVAVPSVWMGPSVYAL
jgi:hypothetical protein